MATRAKTLLLISCGLAKQKSLGNASYENLGLEYIAAYFQSQGWDVKTIDRSFQKMSDHELVQLQLAERYQCIGISTMTWSSGEAAELARTIRSVDDEVLLAVGGCGPSSWPEYFTAHFNYVVVGEGERTFFQLANNPNAPLVSPGHIIEAERMLDWDGNVHPYRDPNLRGLLRMRDFWPIKVSDQRPALVSWSRGCINKCSFCQSRTMWGKRVVYRQPQSIAAEMRSLVSQGYNCFETTDLNLNLNPDWLMAICEELIKQRLNREIQWGGLWNPAFVRHEQRAIAACANAGCVMLSLGVESNSRQSRQKLTKPLMDESRLDHLLRSMIEKGIGPRGLFMLGSPWQTDRDIGLLGEMLESLPLGAARFAFHTPFHGTADWGRYSKDGLIPGALSSLVAWDTAHPVLKSGLTDQIKAKVALQKRFYAGPGYGWAKQRLIRGNEQFRTGFSQFETDVLAPEGLI